jgi:hypothetical protein
MDKKRSAYASQDNRLKGIRVNSNTGRNKISNNMKLPNIRDAKSTKAIGPKNESTRSLKISERYGLAGYES